MAIDNIHLPDFDNSREVIDGGSPFNGSDPGINQGSDTALNNGSDSGINQGSDTALNNGSDSGINQGSDTNLQTDLDNTRSSISDNPSLYQPYQFIDAWLAGIGLGSFQADTTKSPAENMQSLYNWMRNVMSLYNVSSDKSQTNFGSILQYLYMSLSSSSHALIKDLSDGATLEIAEKITDELFSFITAQFNQNQSLYNWYLQQDYNSPVEQIKRLSDAGLNCAFALGNVNSGNAQSAPQVGMIQSPQPSNAGQAEQAAQSAKLGSLGSIFGSVASFIPAVGGVVSGFIRDVTASEIAKQKLPLELANMDSEIAVNNANVLRQQAEIDSMNSSVALSFLDKEFSFSQQELSNAQQQVDTQAMNYRTLFDSHSAEYVELAWQTTVSDKSGNTKTYTLTNEELRKAVDNGGRVGSEYSIVGSDSWENVASATVKVDMNKSNSSSKGSSSSESINMGDVGSDSNSSMVNLSDILGFSGSSEVNDKFTKSGFKSRSDSSHNESIFNDSRSSSKSTVGYTDKGRSFHIGESKFVSVQIRHRKPLPEFESLLKKQLDSWQNSIDHYNTLSEDQQRRLLYLEDNVVRNYKTFCSHLTGHTYADLLKNSFKPKVMTSD